MAMNKLLYVLPALAILGLIPAADADTTQERIERLQERIAELRERIDQNPDSEKVAKWEANIDRLQNRIAELEARQAKTAQSATPQQERTARETSDTTPPKLTQATLYLDVNRIELVFDETIDISASHLNAGFVRVYIDHGSDPALNFITDVDSDVLIASVPADDYPDGIELVVWKSAFTDLHGNSHSSGVDRHTIAVKQMSPPPPDTTPPSFVSATLDLNTGTLTVVFDETVKISTVRVGLWLLANAESVTDRQFLGNNQLSTTSDSETVTVAPSQAVLDWVGDKSLVLVIGNSLTDLNGNEYAGTTNDYPVKVIPADTVPPVITLVGDDPLAHELGEPYTDPGAGTDDGSAVTTDDSAVDVDVAGDYTVTYTATDSNGNEGTATRTVQVRDTAGPAVVSATFDVAADTLTIVFDKTIDLSEVYLEEIGLGRYTLAGTTFDAAAPDSDTLVLDGHWSTAGNVLGLENPELAFGRNSVRDTDGNGIRAVTVPVALANVPVPDATVTITAGGMFAEDAGTIEVQPGGDMTIEVRFVNEHGSDHTVLADLISWNFGHQSEDIEIRSGQSATVTFTVQNEAPRIADDPGRANVYLVFGVADIPGTPEHEPDEILGDRAIKVRIAEPAS